jgi:hypothetical protein
MWGKDMKRKILLISILAVFMLVAISFSTAVKTTNAETKESPLFKIRTKQSIGEKIGNIVEQIKTKFLGYRMFFLPNLQWVINKIHHGSMFLPCITWIKSQCSTGWTCE